LDAKAIHPLLLSKLCFRSKYKSDRFGLLIIIFRATDTANEYAGHIMELGTQFKIAATVEQNK
jgi:hypothetical protein